MKILRNVLLYGFFSLLAAYAAEPAVTVKMSPQGVAKQVRQIRFEFSEAMVPFGDSRLEAPLEIQCPEAGRGFWEDTKNWVYDFARDLPAGVRCSFKLKKDLRSLSKHAMQTPGELTFSTGGPTILEINPSEDSSIQEDAAFVLRLDAKADVKSLLGNVYFVVEGLADKIPVRLVEGKERDAILKATRRTSYENEEYGEGAEENSAATPVEKDTSYVVIQAKRNFPVTQETEAGKRGRKVTLVWGKEVKSKSGIASQEDREFVFQVRPSFLASFSCERENADEDCIPISSMTLNFSEMIPWQDAQKIVLRSGTRTWAPVKPQFSEENGAENTVYSVGFNGPFPEKAVFTLEVPKNIKDDTGRVLHNQASFPLTVKTTEFPPLAKFSRSFGILELKGRPMVPITLRNVEPRLNSKMLNIPAAQLQALKTKNEDFKSLVSWMHQFYVRQNAYGVYDEALLKTKDDKIETFKLEKPNGAKAFEVVGVSLPKPGFYILELQSPKLGASLLENGKPYFTQSAVLVTNMAVHLKCGATSSLAWVTSLDEGKPVSDAQVTIRNGSGDIIEEARTDGQGMARLSRTLLAQCESFSSHRYKGGLYATASKGEDFSFTHTSWDEGIEPFRFQLRSPAYERPMLAHTVLDRSLLRVGDTLHMKHILRKHHTGGIDFYENPEVWKRLKVEHAATGDSIYLPLSWNKKGTAENEWKIPAGSKLGEYNLYLENADMKSKSYARSVQSGSFRIEEFRVPLMKAQILPPTGDIVNKTKVAVDVQVAYLAGGMAAGLSTKLRYAVRALGSKYFDAFEEFDFGNGRAKDAEEENKPSKHDTRSLVLSASGSGKTELDIKEKPVRNLSLQTELEYADPNGEVSTVGKNIPVYASSVLVGIKSDGWMLQKDKFQYQVAVVDLKGKPVAHAEVIASLFERKILSHRKKLVGGFYGYEHKKTWKEYGKICAGKTDALGRLTCTSASPVSGNIYVQAESKDASGNKSYAHASLWLYDKEPWWFEVSDNDRIDLIPEKKEVTPGDQARFQVRMPFAKAQVLVTVEREGVMDSFVTEVTREKSFIDVPVKPNYAPNVFVSALVVRGRVGDVQPTALVDLGKPAYKLGIAEINVGWKHHELGVSVVPEKTEYRVREKAKVSFSLKTPDGKPLPAGSEITVAAVDEGLLELMPNASWNLLEAMMLARGYDVHTYSAQMQIIGKRHFGLKALPTGGGGGKSSARELFDTLLYWKANLTVDDRGRAQAEIPLNDSLTRFKIVGVATAGADLFGVGSTSIQTSQPLSLFSGISPTAREGDQLSAESTVRNATGQTLELVVDGKILDTNEVVLNLPSRSLTLKAGESKKVSWPVTIPFNTDQLTYEISAKSSGTSDVLKIKQQIYKAVPVRVIQATLHSLKDPLTTKVSMPTDALPGRGGIRAELSPTLVSSLAPVKEFMRNYPYTCLEQKISKAVTLEDTAGWKKIGADLPGYLDSDGLAKYFTELKYGSESLSAYLLAIAHEAHWEIPEQSLDKLKSGLQKFVDGKFSRQSPMQTADFRIRKLAVLEALSRYSVDVTSYLESYLRKEELHLAPLSTLLNLRSILSRSANFPDLDTWQKFLENELRARLTYRGTVMGFSNEAADDLWWLMYTIDVQANKFLLSVVRDNDWKNDLPKIVKGLVARQHQGHWDTTVANAWGSLALKAFAVQFEKGIVGGETKVTYAGDVKATDWNSGTSPRTMDFKWAVEKSVQDLKAHHEGSGAPWLTLQSRAAIPLLQPLFKGFQIKKTISAVSQKKKGILSRGDVMKISLEVEAQSDASWIVLDDPIPTGASILGKGLGGESALLNTGSSQDWHAWPSYTERSFTAYRQYYEWFPKGKTKLEYTVRLNQGGTSQLPPTHVEVMYHPEVMADLPNVPIKVEE